MELKRVLFSKKMIVCILALIIICSGFYIKEQNDSFYYERDTYLNFKIAAIELYKNCSVGQAGSSMAARLERVDVFSMLDMYSWIKSEDINNYNEYYAEEESNYRAQYERLSKVYDSNPHKYDPQKYSMIYQAVSEIKTQADYISSYDEFMDNIKAQAEKMSSVSIFAKENSFSIRNIEKTVKAYDGLRGTKLSLGIDEPVTTVMNYSLIHYLMLVFIIVLVLTLLTERKQGLWSIVHASSEGRAGLAVRRLGVIAFCVGLVGTLMYAVLFITSFRYYGGASDVFRNVQSIEMFKNFNLVMPVWEFILLYIVVNIICAVLVAYVVWFIMSVVSNTILAFAALGIVGAVEYVLYTFIPIQSNLSFFKCVNLFAYINPTDTIISYRNINLFSLAVNRRTLCAVLLLVFLIIFAVLCVVVNARKKPVQSLSKLEIFVVRLVDRLVDWYRRIIERLSPLGFELYKVLILQKGIIVIAVLGWYMISSINTNTIYYSREEMMVKEFYENYSGVPGMAAEHYLSRLQAEIDEVYAEYEEANEQYSRGEISYDDLMNKRMKLEAFSVKEAVVYRVRENIFELEMLKDDRGIEGWLLNPLGYKCLFGDISKSANQLHAMLAVFALVLTVSGILSFEDKSRTMKLVRSVYGGRGRFFLRKTVTAVIVSGIIWLLVYGVEVYNIWQLYGLDCFGAPVQSLNFMYSFPLNISIGAYMLMVYLLRFVQLLAVSGIVMAVSAYTGYEASITISTALLVVPGALYITGIYLFGYMSVIQPIGLVQLILYSGGGFGWLLPVLLIILIGMTGYGIASYKWCVTGRRKINA